LPGDNEGGHARRRWCWGSRIAAFAAAFAAAALAAAAAVAVAAATTTTAIAITIVDSRDRRLAAFDATCDRAIEVRLCDLAGCEHFLQLRQLLLGHHHRRRVVARAALVPEA
jgi:anti-sigma-K factor RskA